MFAVIHWDDLTIAFAFLIGVVFGTIVTLRVMRLALNLLRQERDSP